MWIACLVVRFLSWYVFQMRRFSSWVRALPHRFHDWYDGTWFGVTRVGAWCHRSWILLTWLVLALLGYLSIQHFHSRIGSNFDLIVLSYITSVYSATIIVMLWGTPWWTARGVGLLFTVAGDLLLYGWVSIARIIIGESRAIPGPLTDWIRTLFIIGGTLLSYGIYQWVRVLRSTDPALPNLGATRRGDRHGKVDDFVQAQDINRTRHRRPADGVCASEEGS